MSESCFDNVQVTSTKKPSISVPVCLHQTWLNT